MQEKMLLLSTKNGGAYISQYQLPNFNG